MDINVSVHVIVYMKVIILLFSYYILMSCLSLKKMSTIDRLKELKKSFTMNHIGANIVNSWHSDLP